MVPIRNVEISTILNEIFYFWKREFFSYIFNFAKKYAMFSAEI